MSIWAMRALALAAIAGLAALVVLTARSGASGSPSGDLLTARAARPATAVEPLPLTGCRLQSGQGSLAIAGACRGRLPARLTCVAGDEITTLTAQVPSRDERVFTLSILMPAYREPGDYSGQILAQLSATRGSPRWSRRNAPIRVTATSIDFGSTVLDPEPGTPATGSLTLTGNTACHAD